MTASWEDFERLDLAVGRIVAVDDLPGTRKPFFALTVDFGPRGTRRSAAQIRHYERGELLGRQVVAVAPAVSWYVAVPSTMNDAPSPKENVPLPSNVMSAFSRSALSNARISPEWMAWTVVGVCPYV